MNSNQAWVVRLLVCLPCVFAASAAQAVSLNNTVMIPETMTWMQDLSAVTSTSATGVVYMDNGDGTSTYMGMDSVVMGGSTPVWDYSWSLMADADPFIAGTFTVTNTSTMMQTFDITFSLPIAPSFTDGYMTGSLSGSYVDYNSSGGATLNLNGWDGLIDGTSRMNLFGVAGSCEGAGCGFEIDNVSQGPILYSGDVSSTIGIHMNFSLSAGDRATFTTSFEVNPVPLPAAVWLFGSGLLGLIGISRRKAV